jgi:hypothetical protein
MASSSGPIEVTRRALLDFCTEFISRPYLCYTEHGMHAMFFSRLYNLLLPENRYTAFNGLELCVLQKEYPTAHNLGKSKRQHWDISVIKTPVIFPSRPNPYDYLPLAAVVEFGMNCSFSHLEDDITRLCHPEANVENRFAAHLYRLSSGTNRVSGRDWAPESSILCSRESIRLVLKDRPVEVFYGVVDETGTNKSGLWYITGQSIDKVA